MHRQHLQTCLVFFNFKKLVLKSPNSAYSTAIEEKLSSGRGLVQSPSLSTGLAEEAGISRGD